MGRASIALTDPNEAWIASMVERQEYTSKTELINDLVRRAHKAEEHMDYVRSQLIKAEQSGPSNRSLDDIKEGALDQLKNNGKI